MCSPETKVCPACTLDLPLDQFYISKVRNKPTGYCKACTKVAAIAWQKANPDKKKQSDKRVNAKKTPYRDLSPEVKTVRRVAQHTYYERNKDLIVARAAAAKLRLRGEDLDTYRARNAVSNNRARARKLGVAYDFTIADWRLLMAAFDRSCAWCGTPAWLLELDHIVPLTRGGTDVVGNHVPICRPCNAHKSGSDPVEFAALMGVDLQELYKRAAVRAPVQVSASPESGMSQIEPDL